MDRVYIGLIRKGTVLTEQSDVHANLFLVLQGSLAVLQDSIGGDAHAQVCHSLD